MYLSLQAMVILLIVIYPSDARSSDLFNCRVHFSHRRPSPGDYLLGVEHSVDDRQECEHRCSLNHRCSTAAFNRQWHRCHLFQNSRIGPLSRPYRSNYNFPAFTDCPQGKSSPSNVRLVRDANIRCTYDPLPWQRAERSIIFQSYTLVGNSYLPCQELCSSVRQCAGVQYQTRGVQRHQCQLLRSTKPWELASSQTWTVFAKRSCRGQISDGDLFAHEKKPVCNFEYFGQGKHKDDREVIHTLPHLSELQCQYVCSTMVNCIGIESIERRANCILLSSNFVQNDGTIDVKYHRRHHIYMKVSCSTSVPQPSLSKCSAKDTHCSCHRNPCQHGTCLSQQKEGYQHMFCDCDHGFAGQLCDRAVGV